MLVRLALRLILLVIVFSVSAQAQPVEYQVKAGFVLNFLKLVDLPGQSKDSLQVCVAGPPQVFLAFQGLNKAEVDNKPVKVKIYDGSSANSCSAVFVSRTFDATAAFYNNLKAQPILTVGETESFTKNGGLVRFFAQGNKIKFEINQVGADRAGIKFSSRLLQLAKIAKCC